MVENQEDHDLLVRIDEQLKGLRLAFDKKDLELEAYKRDTAAKITGLETIVDNLRTSRAQFYAIAATLSFIIGVVIRIFWK